MMEVGLVSFKDDDGERVVEKVKLGTTGKR